MNGRPAKSNSGNRLVSVAILVGFALFAAWLKWSDGTGAQSAPGSQPHPDPVAGEATGGYDRLANCRVIDTRSNDGDSFLVAFEGGEAVVRLYFVDAPESYVNPQGYNRERIAEQGRYFGGLGERDTVAVGVAAKKFTRELLAGGGFEVLTGWERVYDSERRYGFVRMTGPPYSGRYLSEILVENGLARIHTKGTVLPDGRGRNEFERELRKLESGARTRRAGAWAGGGVRL